MSRFLTRNRLIAMVALILSIAAIPTSLWFVSPMVVIGLGVLVLNKLVLKHTNQMSKLCATRKVSLYDALVIGNYIPKKQIQSVIDNGDNLLTITAPFRTLEATYRILQHVISILPNGAICVITDNGYSSKKPYSLYDIPYFSLVTRKELKVENLIKRTKWSIVYSPLQTIWGMIRPKRYRKRPCPDHRIIELCDSHDIILIYLSTN